MQQQPSTNRQKSNGLLDRAKAFMGGMSWLTESIETLIHKCSNLPETNYRLGCDMVADGRIDDAIMRFKMTLWLAPDHLQALYSLGCLYHHKGDEQMAIDAFVKVLRNQPNHENALYMISTINPTMLKPEMQPRAMPTEMALEYFDGLAPSYDQFQQMAGYQLPALLHQFLHGAFDGKRYNDFVDLGCGTGLCGAQFREEFTNLVGVDIANNMLDMAYRRVDRRGVMIYNRLINQDLRYYLDEANPNSMDVVVCISVFLYLGDLTNVFAGIKKVLRPGGYFACSFDPLNRAGNYGVMPHTGYFGHNIDYVLNLAKMNGFSVIRTGGVMAHPEHSVEFCIFQASDEEPKPEEPAKSEAASDTTNDTSDNPAS